MWYVTVLINVALLGLYPSSGWMQDVNPYPTQEECHADIPNRIEEIRVMSDQFTHKLGVIEQVECLTLDEWFNRNIELGHEPPEGGLEKLRERQEGKGKTNS